ncbi:pro-sigmaK processing inhibitor BofA family protein [Lachnospiraceae bacterium JLR.KK008]
MCVVILCVISLRKKAEFLLNFLLRGIIGMISIFFINEMLAAQNFAIMVGINPWTALTSAILGLPGVLLLYGIHLFKFL